MASTGKVGPSTKTSGLATLRPCDCPEVEAEDTLRVGNQQRTTTVSFRWRQALEFYDAYRSLIRHPWESNGV
jgi:hypothetical protein